jgi:glycerol-1-phosphate dehydrogenase [NAD(P)+]
MGGANVSGTRFELDPTDLPRLLQAVRGWPGAEEYPPLELGRVIVATEAFAQLGEIVSELAPEARSVLIVQDDTPISRAGGDLKRGVAEVLVSADFEVDVCELKGGADGSLHADFDRLEEVIEHLAPAVPVIALGSGTVTDLVKHACFTYQERTGERLALVFCPTAISVLAFSARMAVIAKDGVKRTWPSRLSDALVFDLDALADAPRHLTLAGFGDLAPMFTSFADWRLGEALGLARFFEPSMRIVEDVRVNFPEVAALLGGGEPEGLEMLAKMNVLGGLSATLADESAPLSGYEHVTGHMLDMGSEHFDRALADHGAQVAVALIPHAIAFDLLVAELDPDRVDLDRCYPSAQEMEKVVRDTFAEIDPSGQMADECWSDYSSKLEAWHKARERFEAFLGEWPRQRERLRDLLTPPEEAVRMLAAAGAPLRFSELQPPVSEQEGRWAFEHAHLMRKRFSAGDLYYLLGWLDEGFGDRVFARRDELVDAASA